MKIRNLFGAMALALVLVGCGSTAKTTVTKDDGTLNEGVDAPAYNGLKRTVAIARFSNETEYAKGAFYDKENDPVGKQALDILSAKLAATGKFILLERSDADKIQAELEKAGSSAKGAVADYLIIGSVTEFGRKTTGEVGFVSRSKTQTVEAGVNLRLVDVSSGQVIYSECSLRRMSCRISGTCPGYGNSGSALPFCSLNKKGCCLWFGNQG